MKKVIAIAMLALAIPAAAVASPANDNAQCGTDAASGAFANVNGNFGWLGALGGTPGYHSAVGQDAGATGSNNSAVCGNAPA
jgi:hypothetical protein